MDGPPETKSPPEVAASEGPESSHSGRGLNRDSTTRSVDDYARERYRLDGQIKRILREDAARIAPGKHAANTHRTVGCTWIRVDDLALVKPAQRDSYHYKGLMTCGSVHTCPICASKIQERRRQEVASAIAYATRNGNESVMASYTFPHRVDQPLSLLLRLQSQAIKLLRESGTYKRLMAEVGNIGRIRSLEVTHGQNGWHPHTHELLFVAPGVDAQWLRSRLSVLWLKSCWKVGLYQPERDDENAFRLHSVDVRSGDTAAADYMAKMDDQHKWDLSHEVTKSASKQGKRSGSHPFKLASDKARAYLFVEYVHAMKGQRQLVWSRGLKDAVGIDDKTDEEIAQEESAKVDDRIPVSPGAWRFVLGNDARWELTHAAKTGGAPAVSEYLILLGYDDDP